MIAKVLIWVISVASLGLIAIPQIGMIMTVIAISGFQAMYSPLNSDVYFHDSYIQWGIDADSVPIYPRIWASSLVLLGIVLVILGQFFILRRGSCSIINGSDSPAPPPREAAD